MAVVEKINSLEKYVTPDKTTAVLPIYKVLEILKPDLQGGGRTIWGNAKQVVYSQYPEPPVITGVKVESGRGQATVGIDFKDFADAMLFVFKENAVIDTEIADVLKKYFMQCGSSEKYVDDLKVRLDELQKHQKDLLATLEIAAQFGNGPLKCRVCLASDGQTPLGSVHDLLKWLDVDKDGKHHDWDDWLKEKLYGVSRDIGDPHTPFLIEYHRFGDGRETPMVNVVALRAMIRLCVNKSKIADQVADDALKLWTEKMAANEHLPEVARDFLRGTKRSHDEEESSSSKRLRIELTQTEHAIATMVEESQLALVTKFEEMRNQQFVLSEGIAANRVALAKIEESQSTMMMKLGNLPLQIAGIVNGSLNGFFATGNKFFQYLGDFIQGKKQRKKRSHNARLYPDDQRATDRDMIFQLNLLRVALELSPDLTPRVYDFVKNAYGKRAKCLRTFMHAENMRRSPQEKPLMWTNVPNGGQQYVYLESEKDILRRAWTGVVFGRTRRRAQSCQDMAAAKRRALVAAGTPLGEWTSDTCTLLPDLSGRADE